MRLLFWKRKQGNSLTCSNPPRLCCYPPRVGEDKKNLIPAVTHIDGTARVQTVSKDANPKLWQLIKEFENITGIPIIINTSFNLRGEPIVCTPEDAISSFKRSQMDCLVLGNYVAEKINF